MSALRKDIQRQLFQADDERIHTIIHVVKMDGKKKKRQTYLCIAVTTEHPISVRIYIVKAEREDMFKKKERFHLREVREVDGINPKKPSADFYLSVADRNFSITAGSAEEKDEFIRDLYKLSAHYMPVQMPDFCNVSLPVDQRESDILPIESDDRDGAEMISDYQPISAKEEADFRRLLAKAEIKIGEADKFAEILSAQLQSLDGANIQSMMNSEAAVNQLLSLIDGALDRVSQLEKEVDTCDSILSRERNSVELIEEKDSLSVVERRNKERLRQQLIDYVAALDAVTDKHIRTLEEARLDDPASIARCADAARAVSQFWHGRVPKALLQMRSYQDRNQKLDVIDMFVDRLISHFSALFNNLNDISMSQDWGSLSIPKQSQRYHALSPLSDLMSWLKANRPVPYNAAIDRYVQATSNLYRRLFELFFNALIADVQKTGLSEKRQNSSTFSAKVSLDKSSFSTLDFTADSQVSEQLTALIQTVLGELGPIVDSEQKFCVRFFHINSELLSAAETSSTGSGDSSNIGFEKFVVLGGRNLERFMNEQVRSVMQPLMQSLNDHLKRFSEAICKQNSSNVLLLFVILSKKVLAPQDPGSYFSVTFGTLVVLIKRQFDLYMDSEAKLISEVKISKRLRIGILPTIDRFALFIRNAELIFEHAERRTDLEKWYAVLFRSVCESISRAANNQNSKSPPAVVRFENYQQLYLTLSELKLTCLDSQRKESKLKKEENISIYVRESLGKPLEKVSMFFDQVTNAIARAGAKPEEISYQQQFSRLELKKVINMYPSKEVKKGLDQLYRKMEKHLIDHSSLLQVVWREMQDQFIKQIQEYQMIMTDCYPGSKIDLEVSIDDVLRFFSEIAQEH